MLKTFCHSRGLKAYIVGGLIRDTLLGKKVTDIDIATEGDLQSIGLELASLFSGRCLFMDQHREMVRIVISGLESDLLIDLSPLGNDIFTNLSGRDFTIDAMAISLGNKAAKCGEEKVIDPYEGLTDIRSMVVRQVSPMVFKNDPVRLLRALRLATQLGLEITKETAMNIAKDAHLITIGASERIREELLKLLAEPEAANYIRKLDELALLCEIIPELNLAKYVTQPPEHYWDVYNHLVETIHQSERILRVKTSTPDYVWNQCPRFDKMSEYFNEEISDGHTRLTLLKLAGLLHDIGKPSTKTIEDDGRIRFLGHHSKGAEITEAILERLRFSKRGVEHVKRMVQHHLRPGQMSQPGEMPTERAIYRYFRDCGDVAIDTLYLNMADYLAARGPLLTNQEWFNYSQTISHILEKGLQSKGQKGLPKLITGHDIMERFLISPGPRVGELLNLAQEAYGSGEIGTKKDALELIRNNLTSGGDSA